MVEGYIKENFDRVIADFRANKSEGGHFLYLGRLTKEEVQIFSDALIGNTSVTQLHFSNDFGPEELKILAPALEQLPNLKELEISTHTMGLDGIKLLAPSLEKMQSLEKLNLQDGNIGETGAKALSSSIGKLKNLIDLNLRNNNMGAEGIKALAPEIGKLRKLEYLDLEKNNLHLEENSEYAGPDPKGAVLRRLFWEAEREIALNVPDSVTYLEIYGDNSRNMIEEIRKTKQWLQEHPEDNPPSLPVLRKKNVHDTDSTPQQLSPENPGNGDDGKGGKNFLDNLSPELAGGGIGLAALAAGLLSGMDFFMALILAALAGVAAKFGMEYVAKQKESAAPDPNTGAAVAQPEINQGAALSRQRDYGGLALPENRLAVTDLPPPDQFRPTGGIPGAANGRVRS